MDGPAFRGLVLLAGGVGWIGGSLWERFLAASLPAAPLAGGDCGLADRVVARVGAELAVHRPVSLSLGLSNGALATVLCVVSGLALACAALTACGRRARAPAPLSLAAAFEAAPPSSLAWAAPDSYSSFVVQTQPPAVLAALAAPLVGASSGPTDAALDELDLASYRPTKKK